MEIASATQNPTREPNALAPETLNLVEAWLLLPEGDRAELLMGRIVYKAMANLEHGAAVIGISEQIGRLQGPSDAGGGGWWLSQEVDLFLAGQGLRPDLVGWRMEKNPHAPQKVNVGSKHFGVYVTPPDWVCEVLSGSTRARDEEDGVKWKAYFDAGVEHYWLIDLHREQITVYQRGERSYEPIEVAGREAVKALPPFVTVDFVAKRVFLLTEMMKPRGG